jgi:predicted metalloprotease
MDLSEATAFWQFGPRGRRSASGRQESDTKPEGKIMRNVILGSVGLVLLVGACAPRQAVVADTSGRAATEFPVKEFVSRIVGDTEDLWKTQFKAIGRSYQPTKVVLFTNIFPSACGIVRATSGPFYCSGDQRVYLDPAYLQELRNSHVAGGDFAAAYVIVYAIGHHVQHQLGTLQKFEESAKQMGALHRAALLVRLNLQADCYTGIWTYSVQRRNLIDPGDLEVGLPAAQELGDVVAGGTSAQRMRWFKQGLATGDSAQCDTFAAFQP